jgi:hypothetical protein
MNNELQPIGSPPPVTGATAVAVALTLTVTDPVGDGW